MKAHALAKTLDHYPKKMPVTINGFGVLALEVAGGRIRRDVMSTSFSEMPDKPRDEALVMRFGDGTAMTVSEVRKALEAHGDLEVFVWGEPVTAVRCVQAYYDWKKERHVYDRGTNEVVATPMRWTELSDGTRTETHVWIEPTPTTAYDKE